MTTHNGQGADDSREISFLRKLFRYHVFNHQRRNLEAEFSEYQEHITNANRRSDLEQYILVALAIGRSPEKPPQWALDECERLYVRDASHQKSVTETVRNHLPDDALLNTIIAILEAHPDNLAAFFSEAGNGEEFLPNDMKTAFKKQGSQSESGKPDVEEEQDDAEEEPDDAEEELGAKQSMKLIEISFSTTAAMRDVLSHDAETVLHDDGKLKSLQRDWRTTSKQDKQALLWRAHHIAWHRRSGKVPRFPDRN